MDVMSIHLRADKENTGEIMYSIRVEIDSSSSKSYAQASVYRITEPQEPCSALPVPTLNRRKQSDLGKESFSK